jgi:transposase
MISNEEAKKLKDKIRELEEENAKLLKEKEKIKKEFEEFKAKHAVTVANLRKAMNIKPTSQKKPKPLGAPKGHKGYARHIPERIDYIKQLILKRCPHCNTKILGATQEIRSRHVTDIKLTTEAKTTRYDIHRKYCRNCGKLVEPEVPNVLPHARFGLNFMLLVMYLRLGLRLPCNKVCDYIQTMRNLKICEAEIIAILRQLILAFGDYYSHLERIVKLARVKHSDTTSWRINSKNYFVWIFIGCGAVLYKIRKHNNHKVGLAFFGHNQKGNVLVVYRFGALLKLARKAGFLLQLCWPHILQDSKELAQNFGAEGRYVHRKLKDVYALAISLNHKGSKEIVEQLKGEVLQLTLRRYTHSTVRKFVNNLYHRDVNDLFRFVTDPEIDATNNISERELRALVIIRKISNGSRSVRGAHATAMLLSVIQTLRLSKKNVLSGLKEILNSPSG